MTSDSLETDSRVLIITKPRAFAREVGQHYPFPETPVRIPGLNGKPPEMDINLSGRADTPVEVIGLLFPETPQLGTWQRDEFIEEFKAHACGAPEVLQDGKHECLVIYRILLPPDPQGASGELAGWVIRRLEHPGGGPAEYPLSPYIHSYESRGDNQSIQWVWLIAEAMARWDKQYRRMYSFVTGNRPPWLDCSG